MVIRHIGGLSEHFQRLEDTLAADMEDLMRRLVAESMERERQLRVALADQITSGLGRRWFGAGLFIVGVCLSAVANLVG
jgi:hypothetical protein